MSELVLNPWADTGPIQQRFVVSDEFEVCLMAPRGEGKTEAGWRRLTLHAALQPESCRPIPSAIIRDTWKNLERTTLRSLLFPHPGSFCEKIRPLLKVSDGGAKIVLPGFWEANLFGVDSLGDLSRLQSLQLGVLWLEEPAPAAAEDIGGGLEERVVTVGITSLRHPCDWRTVQITSNYPDESHWLWQRYAIRRVGKLFRIPRGENLHVPEDYRRRMEDALQGDKGLLQRLVLGMPGFVVQGEEVTPEYDETKHRSSRVLEPYPNLIGYRFWDGYSNPACIIAQMTPRGQLQILAVFAGQKMGVKQLIREFVRPACDGPFACIPEWEDIGDPSMAAKDQSDYDQSAARVIEEELGTNFRGGPVSWQVRKEAMKNALLKEVKMANGGTQPFLLLSAGPLTQPLHQALRGGWHYRRFPNGQVGRTPVKDDDSHPADALTYGVCELLHLSGAGLIDAYVYPADEDFVDGFGRRAGSGGWDGMGRSSVTGY